MKLRDIKAEFAKYIVCKDEWALDMVMATLIGNSVLNSDPLWTMIIGPSSGGKTTLIAPACSLSNVHFIDDLTEKTLLSGFKVKGQEVSLLNRIGKTGIMAFSDFTTILMKNPNSKGEILTQLKMVYDGKFTKFTGTGGMMWEGKIGLIAASTPDIYAHLEAGRSMGERFLYYWLDQPTDEEVAKKQQETNMSSKDITKAMQGMYLQYCQEVATFIREKGLPTFSLTEDQKKRVRDAAIFCVNGKATVHTDFKSGKVDQIPNKAGVGRDNKTFDVLLHALQVMDAFEYDDWSRPISEDRIRLVDKCAYSSINRERRKIMEVLIAQPKAITPTEIGTAKGLGMEKDSVEKYLVPLHAVGMIRKQINSGAHKWYIDDPKTIDFITRVSPSVKDEEIIKAQDFMEADDSQGFYSGY